MNRTRMPALEYGLIAKSLSHSYSKEIHALIAEAIGIPYTYELCEIAEEDVPAFLEERAFRGVNVTIPYKETVIPALDALDASARGIGAVNTIVNRDGRLTGYNTDFIGMEALIAHMGVSLAGAKVLVLGTGGTSKTARAVAWDLDACEVLRVSRTAREDAITYEEAAAKYADADFIINTTPSGMFPHTDAQPIDLAPFTQLKGVIDAIYNPLETRLVQQAHALGIEAEGGLFMLVAQAVAAAALFLDCTIGFSLAERIYAAMLARKTGTGSAAAPPARVEIRPSRAAGIVSAPPSKSMAHRLLICAGLAQGESVLHGIEASDDIEATIACLSALGVRFASDDDGTHVTGIDVRAVSQQATLPCNECGSTLRFFIPLAWATQATQRFTGSARLMERPQNVYEDIAAHRKLTLQRDENGLAAAGPLKPGTFRIRGDVSSQFASGLLFALPLLDADSRIEFTSAIESRPYIDLTLQALQTFGVQAHWDGAAALAIPGGQRYAPAEATVEGDWSNAAFLEAFNTIEGNVQVMGLNEESLQGDRIYRSYFDALVGKGPLATTISGGAPELDIANCPDLGPVLIAVAALRHGATFTGTRRLAIKESDRAAAMAQELACCGAHIVVQDDAVVVLPAPLHAPDRPLDAHGDHRIAMALSIVLSQVGGILEGADAVSKSFPGFFGKLEQLGIEVRPAQ